MIEIIIVISTIFLIAFILLIITLHNYKERTELKDWAKSEIAKEKRLKVKAQLLAAEYKNHIEYVNILELEQMLKAVIDPNERKKIEEEIEMLKGVIADEEI